MGSADFLACSRLRLFCSALATGPLEDLERRLRCASLASDAYEASTVWSGKLSACSMRLQRVLEGAAGPFAHIFDGLSSGWRLWQSVQLRWHTQTLFVCHLVRQRSSTCMSLLDDLAHFQGRFKRPDSLILLSANIGAYAYRKD